MRSFLDSAKRLFYVTSKPTSDELKLLLKITALGVALMGMIGFVIRVLFWIVGLVG